MRRSLRRASHRSWAFSTILVAALSPIAALLSVAVSGDNATAAPAAGYAVTGIPITESGPSVAVNPATDTVYVASYGGPELLVIDGATNALTTSIPLSPASQWPTGVAVDPATNTVYVAVNQYGPGSGSGSAGVVVINGSTDQITATIPLASGASAIGVAVNSSTDTIYVAENVAGAVAVIDGSTNSVTTTVSTGTGSEPVQLAVDETSNVVWVGELGGQVLAISGASNTVTLTTSVSSAAGGPIAVDPASDTVYAGTTQDGLAVIAGDTGTVSSYIAGISLGSITLASGIAFDPGSGTVFATNSAPNYGTTWVVDAATNTVTDTIPRGGVQIAVDTETGSVYESPYNPDDVAWVLTPSTTNTMAPLITSSGTTMSAGVPSSFTIVGSAVPAATYTETGALPAGVTLSSSGVLSGTPAIGTAGVYPITLTASNGLAPDDSQPFTLTISEAPTFTSADQATFYVGAAGSFTVTATVANPSYPAGFTEAGTLPEGLIFSSTGVLSGTPAAGTAGVYPISITASTGLGASATQSFTLTVDGGASYVPVGPVRVLDTRNGTGGYYGQVGPGGTIGLKVTGVDGVPSTGVVAVVLNVTATDPTDSSFVTVYADGTPQPISSNLNFTAGETIANLVTVPVSSDGQIDFYNHTGSVDLVADLEGYYTAGGTGSLYVPLSPSRVLDTRNGTGGYSAPVGPGGTLSLPVEGVDGVPASDVTAVVLNVTVTDPTDSSFITAYPDGTALPTASNINFTAGETIPNLVIVPVGADGDIDLYNHTGSVNLVADLEGYYTSSGTGSSFVPLGPARILDTRSGTGGYSGPVGPGGTISLQITGENGVAASGVTAVVLNVTVTEPTDSSFITVYPGGTTLPTASNLNFTAGESIPNLVVVQVGADGEVDFYNHTGSTELIADLAGYFEN